MKIKCHSDINGGGRSPPASGSLAAPVEKAPPSTDLQRRLEKQKPKSAGAEAVNKQEEERLRQIQEQKREERRQAEAAMKQQQAKEDRDRTLIGERQQSQLTSGGMSERNSCDMACKRSCEATMDTANIRAGYCNWSCRCPQTEPI